MQQVRNKKRDGIVLVTTMLAISIIVMLISTVVYANFGGFRLASNFYDRELALMAANSGVQYAIHEFQKDLVWNGCGSGVKLNDGSLWIVENNGNVVGVLKESTSASDGRPASRSAFRIKFNYEDGAGGADGLNDSGKNVIKSPYVSTNNLLYSSDGKGYHADSNGKKSSSAVAYSVPPSTCNLFVEGFSGNGLDNAKLDAATDLIALLNDLAEKETVSRQLVEVNIRIDPTHANALNSVLCANGNIKVNSKTFNVKTPDGRYGSSIRAVGDMDLSIDEIPASSGDLDAGSGGAGESTFTWLTGYFSGNTFDINNNSAANGATKGVNGEKVTEKDNKALVPAIEWDEITKADSSKDCVKLGKKDSGCYAWIKEKGDSEPRLVHYKIGCSGEYTEVGRDSGLAKAAVINRKDLSISFKNNVFIDGDFVVMNKINEWGMRPVVYLGGTEGDKSIILSTSGNVSLLGSVLGSGSITSEGDIAIEGTSVLEADPGLGVSMYSKKNITIKGIDNTSKLIESVEKTNNGKNPYDEIVTDPQTGLSYTLKDMAMDHADGKLTYDDVKQFYFEKFFQENKERFLAHGKCGWDAEFGSGGCFNHNVHVCEYYGADYDPSDPSKVIPNHGIRFHGENDARVVLGAIFDKEFDQRFSSPSSKLSKTEVYSAVYEAMRGSGIGCNRNHTGASHPEDGDNDCDARTKYMDATFLAMLDNNDSALWNHIDAGISAATKKFGISSKTTPATIAPKGSGIEKVKLSGVSKAKGLATVSSKGNNGAASRKESYINELLSKDGKVNYGDQRLTGVLYAWGNISVDIGESQLDVRGSMISYGGDPSNPDQKLEFNLIKAESPVKRFYQAERDKEDASLPKQGGYGYSWTWRPSSTAHLNRWCGDGTSTSTEKSEGGNINIAQAGEVDLTFDPSYLNNFGGISTNKKVTISLYTNR
ncbi:MAG: hypothetical protein K6A35_05925 [bacterium]|nr:hypothetical protein [bacterium]